MLATLLVASLPVGCASELSLRAPDVDLRKARLAFMPSMVAIYRIEGCDLVFDEWRSRGGRAKVDGWLKYYGAATHARLAGLNEVAGTDVKASDFYTVMNSVTGAMFADWGRRPLGEWRLEPLASWGEVLHVDYLAFAIVRGSVLLQPDQALCGNNMIVSPSGRAGILVVELKSGRVVRFRATKLASVEADQITEAMEKLTDAVDGPTPAPK
jgi:hypothetical protein